MNHGFVKVASAIPSVKVADCQYNVQQIESLVIQAEGKGVEIICFPELSLTAYSCGDLFCQQLLLDEAEMALIHLMNTTRSLNIISIVGLPVPYCGSLLNCAAVVQRGKIHGLVPKTYIPNHKEFYEKRWFRSGADVQEGTVLICGQQVTVSSNLLFQTPSCQFGVEFGEDVNAPVSPSSVLALQGADIIFNLSADSDTAGKYGYLQNFIALQSLRALCGYVYSSCGFGESTQDLVFDGKGIICECGTMLAEAKRRQLTSQMLEAELDVERIRCERRQNTIFADCASQIQNGIGVRRTFHFVETERIQARPFSLTRNVDPHPFSPSSIRLDERCQEIFEIQTQGLASRIKHTGAETVVVGISGGLACLCGCIRQTWHEP